MGILNSSLVEERSKMKFFVAACLVAAAFAEPEAKADADAALLYGAYGYAGYAGYAGYPYALGYSGYAGYPYAYGAYGAHYIGKREAEAEPEADPALLYGAYGYAGYAGYPYAGLRTYAGYPYATAYGAYPYAYGAYGHYLGKRSADAEPEADAALLYGAYGYAGYAAPYAYGYAGYAGYPYAAAYGAFP